MNPARFKRSSTKLKIKASLVGCVVLLLVDLLQPVKNISRQCQTGSFIKLYMSEGPRDFFFLMKHYNTSFIYFDIPSDSIGSPLFPSRGNIC